MFKRHTILGMLAGMFTWVMALLVLPSTVWAANYMARDHLVVDLRFGIEWLRCSVGQV